MNTSERYYDVIIIGGGIAGLSAAIYACRSGASVAVVEEYAAGGTACTVPEVENYLGFARISGYELSEKAAAQAKSFGADFIYARAQSIEDGKVKRVKTSAGELTAAAVVLALGSTPRKLGIEGEDGYLGRGLSYCATCDGNFFRGKKVAVYGVGSHAARAANYLLPIASEVIMLGERLHSVEGATAEECTRITRLLGSPLEAVEYDSPEGTRKISVDGLFVELGHMPATDIVKNLVNTDKFGYIKCDEYMCTSVSGIFAAGDARVTPLRQIVTAAADGAIAGQYAAVYAKKAKL